MPKIIANARVITKAINGTPAVDSIEQHDRLYLEVRGDGKAAWRIRYRPRPNANQRWYTIAEDARAVAFDDVARKANELLSGLQLQGVDPQRAEARRPGQRAVCGIVFSSLARPYGQATRQSHRPPDSQRLRNAV